MDPLEQLNLIVWMSWAPHGLFVRQGFVLEAIGPFLPVPLSVRPILKAAGWEPKIAVSPDILLRHRGKPYWRLLECKTSSFGSDSSTAAQAAGLLSLPPQWIEVTRRGSRSQRVQAEVCYVLNAGQEQKMQVTLDEIRRRLQAHGITANPSGAWGIYRHGRSLHLRGASSAICDPGGQDTGVPLEGVYPLLPIDPSINARDLKAWKDLQERLRSSLTSWMGKNLPQAVEGQVDLHLEDHLLRPAIPVWDLWEDEGKRTVRRRARFFVRKVLESVRGRFTVFEELPQGYGWRLQVTDEGNAREILRYLLSASARERELTQQELDQLQLFD